jgi:hypothetical protein
LAGSFVEQGDAMSVISAVVVVASEEAAAQGLTPPWVFGLVAFGFLAAALIVTLMIKVGD